MGKLDILKFIADDLRADNNVECSLYLRIKEKKVIGEKAESLFTLGYSNFLLCICALKLVERGALSLSHRLDRFIPQYTYAQGVTIEDLLYGNSGICDYRYENPNLSFTDTHEITALINPHRPDSRNKISATNQAFLYKIIEMACGCEIRECLRELIFLPLGIEISDVENGFEITFDSLKKFSETIAGQQILSQSLWEKMLTFDTENMGMGCRNENGFVKFTLGDSIDIYVDFQSDILLLYAEEENEKAVSITTTLMDNVEILCVYPQAPILTAYNSLNAGRVMGITTEPYQLGYACDVKTALAYGYSRGDDHSCYVIEDGLRAVGLFILHGRMGQELCGIDIIIIDKKYQRKGYGKFALDNSIKILSSYGCERIDLAVFKENTRAVRMYERSGFSVVAEQEEYVVMERKIK